MRIVLSAVLVCSLFGCGKKKEGDTSTKTSETKPADTAAPGEKPADPTTPPPSAPAAAAAVDTCAFVSKDDVEKVLGSKLMADPDKQAATGSMLGGCSWMTDKGVIGTVSARPAAEYDGTVGMDKDAKDLAGVGERAKMTKYGALVQPAGKPYFMQVMVMANGGNDEAKTTELSKLAVAGAK
jgi:hypothetical protein